MLELERCYITHNRRERWNSCPLCGAPLRWVRSDKWTPCDETPALYVPGGPLKLVLRREFIGGCELYDAARHGPARPKYALVPHVYTCPALRRT